MHGMTHTFFYPQTDGPIRNGNGPRHKRGIYPTISHVDSFGDLLSMAESVIEWGNERWANDHGSYEDHLALLNFVNVVIQREMEGTRYE